MFIQFMVNIYLQAFVSQLLAFQKAYNSINLSIASLSDWC